MKSLRGLKICVGNGHIVCYMAFQDIGHLIIIIINWTNATAHLKAIKDLAHLI